jgi:hypothetical protein
LKKNVPHLPAVSWGITTDTINAVNNAARLSDVVEKHVEVRRTGSTITACCPFHNDKNPSMVGANFHTFQTNGIKN